MFRMSSPSRKKVKKDVEVTKLPPDGFIRFDVDKLSTLSEEFRHSSEVEVRGVPWRVGVHHDDDFAVHLFCMSTQSTLWNMHMDVETTLVHSDITKSVTYKEHCYFDADTSDGVVLLQNWNKIIHDRQGLIEDDKITVEARFWITSMKGVRTVPLIDFTDPYEPRHDVALLIDGEKVYVSKQILAAHSSVFNTMFYGGFAEKNKSEIELKDVDREEFLEMLRVIYPSCKKITEDSAEYLLKLGDQFQITYVTDRAEEFLIDSDDIPNTEKFRIAEKFRLYGLKEHCLSKLKKKQEFKNIKDSSFYDDLSPETKDLLFDRLLETYKMSSPPRKKEKKEEEVTRLPPDGFIRFEVDKVSTLDEEGRYSTEVDVRGVSWRASVFNDTDLFVDLYCMSTQSVPWKIDVNAEFTLVHSDIMNNVTVKKHRSLKHDYKQMCVFDQTWEEFIEDSQGFIIDDKITIEIRFWITNMRGIRTASLIDFTDPDKPQHDVTLVIEGKKIYVSKQILAAHSSVFNTMFYGEFADKNKSEMELKDVDRDEFLEMLHVIYPSNKKITDDSAEYLLKLGDQLQIASVIDRSEQFLIKSYEFSNNDKLRISDKFKLLGLQEHCFSELETEHDFNEVKESSIYADLSSETKALLFERLLSTVLGTSSLSSQIGGQRALKSFNDAYIRAWQGPMGNAPWYVDLAPHCRMCEHWHILDRNGKAGSVMLRAYVYKFLRAMPDGRVDLVDTPQRAVWEMWTPCKNGDGTWSFRSHHGTWLSAHRADGIVCTKRHKSKGEKFRLESWH